LAKENLEALNLALVRDEFDADTFDPNPDNEQNIEENIKAPVDTFGEGNESNMTLSAVPICDVPTSSRIEWRLYYTEEDLRALMSKLINLLEYPNHKDISHIDLAICDSAIMDEEGNARVTDEVIKNDQMFESLDAMKFFFLGLRGTTPSAILCCKVK
jgi:hypothetical protein